MSNARKSKCHWSGRFKVQIQGQSIEMLLYYTVMIALVAESSECLT